VPGQAIGNGSSTQLSAVLGASSPYWKLIVNPAIFRTLQVYFQLSDLALMASFAERSPNVRSFSCDKPNDMLI